LIETNVLPLSQAANMYLQGQISLSTGGSWLPTNTKQLSSVV